MSQQIAYQKRGGGLFTTPELLHEPKLDMRQAAAACPEMGNRLAIQRLCRFGNADGVRLESMVLQNKFYTSHAAMLRFQCRVNGLDPALIEACEQPSGDPQQARVAEAARAESFDHRLTAEGV